MGYFKLSMHRKPYLVIPKLIPQPTWGGDYIPALKNWESLAALKDLKIGQSYELFGDSKLLLTITDSRNEGFVPELGSADSTDTLDENFPYEAGKDFVVLSQVCTEDPDGILGASIFKRFGTMPLLNKLTQSLGNSFQLHIKPHVFHSRWQPKAESWYYLEQGLLTCGIQEGISVDEYKDTCKDIEQKMKGLSRAVLEKKLSLEEAKDQAKKYIQDNDPHRFVNIHEVEKYALIDLSKGGLHHSWEENKEKFPLGNVLYEVQQDVMDPVCTVRSFDQGKFKDDGSIREIHIDDYFNLLDTDPESNKIETLTQHPQGERLLTTEFYCLDIVEVTTSSKIQKIQNSFEHLYVRVGVVEVKAADGVVTLSAGHSCFIPFNVQEYGLTSSNHAVVLKTFIE